MELSVLKSVLKKVNNPAPGLIARRWFLVPLWFLVLLSVLGILQLHEAELLGGMLYMLLLLFFGIIIGAATMLRVAEKQWPFITPHVSAESIEKRIDEINA